MKKLEKMDILLPLVVREIKNQKDNMEFSCTDIQRMFNVGYPRASFIVDQMEEMGIVADTKPRRLNISENEYSQFLKLCNEEEYAKIQNEKYDEISALTKEEAKEEIREELKKIGLDKIELFDCDGQKLSDKYTSKVISFIENNTCLDAEDVQSFKEFILKNGYKFKCVEFALNDEKMEIKQNIEIKNSIVICFARSSALKSGFVSAKIKNVIDKFNGNVLFFMIDDENPEKFIILF